MLRVERGTVASEASADELARDGIKVMRRIDREHEG